MDMIYAICFMLSWFHNLRVCEGGGVGGCIVALVEVGGVNQAFGRLGAALTTGHGVMQMRLETMKRLGEAAALEKVAAAAAAAGGGEAVWETAGAGANW